MQQQEAIVDLDDFMLRTAQSMASESYSRYEDSDGHYNNTAHSHLIGRLGELAVEKWLQDKCPDYERRYEWEWANIDPAFRSPYREHEYDISFEGVRYEIKTWSLRFWLELGRCVSESQMPYLLPKAERIIWCSYDGIDSVTLHGWNTTLEVSRVPTKPTGPAKGRKVINHQMPLRMMHGMWSI